MKKRKTKLTADTIVLAARKHSGDPEMQLEFVRWYRDVNFRGNIKAQLACATAIDKLKGYYK